MILYGHETTTDRFLESLSVAFKKLCRFQPAASPKNGCAVLEKTAITGSFPAILLLANTIFNHRTAVVVLFFTGLIDLIGHHQP